MISTVLKRDIERYVGTMEHGNPLYTRAHEGRLTPQIAVEHLHQVQHLVSNTPVHLERARWAATAVGDLELGAYYEAKRDEEHGHDQWARDDIAGLGERYDVAPSCKIVPSLTAQLGYLEEAIDRDPALYLAYILFAELHLVIAGERWLHLIEERCGIAMRHFSVIGRHVELDKEHTAEGLVAIDALVKNAAKLEPMREVIATATLNFEGMCREVVELGESHAPTVRT